METKRLKQIFMQNVIKLMKNIIWMKCTKLKETESKYVKCIKTYDETILSDWNVLNCTKGPKFKQGKMTWDMRNVLDSWKWYNNVQNEPKCTKLIKMQVNPK